MRYLGIGCSRHFQVQVVAAQNADLVSLDELTGTVRAAVSSVQGRCVN